MAGWPIFESSRASRRKRALTRWLIRCSGRIVLTATWRSRRGSNPRYTSPMPPLPRRDSMRICPIVDPTKLTGLGYTEKHRRPGAADAVPGLRRVARQGADCLADRRLGRRRGGAGARACLGSGGLFVVMAAVLLLGGGGLGGRARAAGGRGRGGRRSRGRSRSRRAGGGSEGRGGSRHGKNEEGGENSGSHVWISIRAVVGGWPRVRKVNPILSYL